MTQREFATYDEMSDAAFALVRDLVVAKPDAHLCLATGNSPTGLYARLAEHSEWFSAVRVTQLDEWAGLRKGHPGTSKAYLEEHVLGPWRISPDRFLGFDPTVKSPEVECMRIEAALRALPPIDLCILGIGVNGHIALNEPAPALATGVHVSRLADSTRIHPMLTSAGAPPTEGMTLGVGDILRSRQILLLICGKGKEAVTELLRIPAVTTMVPASILHVHENAACLTVRTPAPN